MATPSRANETLGGATGVGPGPEDDDFVHESILRQFELVQKLGHSPFAVVWKAIDKRTRGAVALKKLYGAFDDAKRAQQAYRELAILERLQGSDVIVQLRNVLLPSNSNSVRDAYLVFGVWDTDLFALIRAGVLEDKHNAYITVQILEGLAHIHRSGFVHRDIKPSNILINARCEVQICDFGHARSIQSQPHTESHEQPVSYTLSSPNLAQAEHAEDVAHLHNEVDAGQENATRDHTLLPFPPMTDYLGSRWYRAPESLLGAIHVQTAVDIWGVGCVLGELILREPLFPGHSTTHQLQLILEMTGLPSEEELQDLDAPTALEQLDPKIIGRIEPRATSEMFPISSGELLDFLRACLQFTPTRRITCNQALTHPFVIEFFHESYDAETAEPVEPLELDDDTVHRSKVYYRAIRENVDKRTKKVRNQLGAANRFGYTLT
ncbi:Mitogen-activated protein kinase [Hondaea fermentalgiana]|uniref:Mitogen-activated protein kinase n=1 Tax=Hondaea fermentalgiana TaxID=2315210 RepID=A0A2R5G3L8_9STRA|nr:Mitogen-activated protein kinase [Hondaea fermentalgiana]|eukprot:GBG24919.1 Mitogen-activated protein kinase [Hondaea fermentalgiana]